MEKEAWEWIFKNWGSSTWLAIPEKYSKTLNLDSRLGLCHCCFVTKIGANGLNQSVQWLNRSR